MRRNWALFALVVLSVTFKVEAAENERINGVNFVSPKYKSELDGMDSVKRINANWIAICNFAFLYKNTSTVEYNSPKNWWGDNSDGLQKQLKRAKSNRLNVLLKAHFWVMNGSWAGDFDLSGNKKVEFEKNLTNYILYLANVAEQNKIEMLCIGTELSAYSRNHPDFFIKLISQVRKVFKGKLTYAANFDEYEHVKFWDKLDYIGIDAYFPLSDKATPTVAELINAWKPKANSMQKFSQKQNKQLIFMEYGYRSIHRAASRQWEFERTPTSQAINYEAQKNAYTAFYSSLWHQDFVAGGFLWKWYNQDAVYKNNTNSDYTPQHKVVESIIKQWYSKKQ